jgi:primosomal protein N'
VRRERRGFIVERVENADRSGVKALAGVVGDGPVFEPELLRLCLWIADYYLAPIGRVLAAALPGGLEGFGGSRARKRVPAAEQAMAVLRASKPGRPRTTRAACA